jgi:beta-alanine degradation protein BauB
MTFADSIRRFGLAALAATGSVVVGAWAAMDPALDPATAAKGIYVLKLDDADARVFEATFKPGQKTALHEHPKHVAYALTGGELTIHVEGKEPQVIKLEAGMAVAGAAEKHWAQNTGKKTVKVLVVELKGK